MSGSYSFEIAATHVTAFLHPAFQITPSAVRDVWRDLSEICAKHGCKRVLAVSDSALAIADFEKFDAYKLAEELVTRIPGLRFACCWPGLRTDTGNMLFVTVASNRGVTISFFNDRSAALSWLLAISAQNAST